MSKQVAASGTSRKRSAQGPSSTSAGVEKSPTGIEGFDELARGGLPKGRPTLICGGPGCGKTLFGMEFLVRGARQFGEAGVFLAFEETAAEIASNVTSLGFDVGALVSEKLLVIDHVHLERSEIQETGEYDLEGLFLRLGHAIDSIGARRVVIDTLETLFSSFDDHGTLRAELRRLFRWLKEKGVTAIITAERGDGALTRQGLEEYVSDCVIQLDNRVSEQVTTRRLRIVKYRGSTHGANEYPFLIGEKGISVLPLSSITLEYQASEERVSSGVAALDAMLGGQGYFRGSSILVSGSAGSGKSTLAAHFACAVCASGQRVSYFAFEESPSQILRNMRSIGLDLRPWVEEGLLAIHASRPSMCGLERHLVQINELVREHGPQAVILDPISALAQAGSPADVQSMLARVVDAMKDRGITAMLTNLSDEQGAGASSAAGVSSLMDTWLLLREVELGGERNRGLSVMKSRGMAHSNQIREFVIGERGIELKDVYVGAEGALTGSMRVAQESRERAEEDERIQALARRRRALESQLALLRSDLAAQEEELRALETESTQGKRRLEQERQQMGRSRKTDVVPAAASRERKRGS
jgi:circadian clock protein KaiC